jgi:uncharacterized protein with HEPN domain
MSAHKRLVHLRQMLDHAREAINLSQNKSRMDLDTDRLLNLSLVRLLEIIGEAANRILPNEQPLYSEIPWSQIISLRNRLIHGYDTIDFDILWEIITKDLPPLIKSLEAIISSETPQNS